MSVEVVVEHEAWAEHGITDELVKHAIIALWRVVAATATQSEMTVLLTNDDRVRALNRQFRGKDKPTNVLSFPSGDDEYIGDVAIAFETVVREAGELGVSLSDHVTHLAVHGTLHLLGYDHESEDDAERMEQIEVSVLKDLGIANPYRANEEAQFAGIAQVEHRDP